MAKIGCAGGKLDGRTCVCPAGTKRQQLSGTRYRCVGADGGGANAAKITCTGGNVSGNRCLCPQGSRAVQSGANAYRCVTKDGNDAGGGKTGGGRAAKIDCAGGSIAGNVCVCPKNTTRQQLAASKFRCVPKAAGDNDNNAGAAKIVCQGGAAQGKRCVCPQGSRAQQTGANAYRCETKDGGGAQQKKKQQQLQDQQLQQQKKKQQELQQQKKKQQLQDQQSQQQKKKQQELKNQQLQQQKKKQQLQQQQQQQQQQQKKQQGGAVQCIGGQPAGNRCVCPQGQKAVQAGPKVFRMRREGWLIAGFVDTLQRGVAIGCQSKAPDEAEQQKEMPPMVGVDDETLEHLAGQGRVDRDHQALVGHANEDRG